MLSHIKADSKQILREPIMLFLFLLPVLLISLGKLGVILLPDILKQILGINILNYIGYIEAMLYLLVSGMLGTVTGFMMLDDKDARIYELMSITPLGKEGYLYNRLCIPAIMVGIYSIVICLLFLNTPIYICLILIVLGCMEMIMIGMALFYFAEDKVKGLTYAKGLNIVLMFSLIELINNPFLHIVAKFIPTYWISKIIIQPTMLNIFTAIVVHISWLFLTLIIHNR